MKRCSVCKQPIDGNDFVTLMRDGEETSTLFHNKCFDTEKYGQCDFCGDEYVLPLRELRNGECEEHRGEGEPADEEEAQGRQDLIDNITKNF